MYKYVEMGKVSESLSMTQGGGREIKLVTTNHKTTFLNLNLFFHLYIIDIDKKEKKIIANHCNPKHISSTLIFMWKKNLKFRGRVKRDKRFKILLLLG